ncbi:hypothetical protein D3Z51_08045, partial [Clostridiaceae bacterium]
YHVLPFDKSFISTNFGKIQKVLYKTFPEIDDRVFFYDERDKTLYATKMEEVVTNILEFEPWDQVDACVFNREMKWVLAIAHEDALLFLEENSK